MTEETTGPKRRGRPVKKTKYGSIPSPLQIKERAVPKHNKLVDPDSPRPDPRGNKRMVVDRKLTRKQELFVKELVSNDGLITFKEAAIRAGYPETSAIWLWRTAHIPQPSKPSIGGDKRRAISTLANQRYGTAVSTA